MSGSDVGISDVAGLSLAEAATRIAADRELLEVARQAIEDTLIEFRDARIAQLRNNGLVVKEANGADSYIIRFGPEDAVRIGLLAIAAHLTKVQS